MSASLLTRIAAVVLITCALAAPAAVASPSSDQGTMQGSNAAAADQIVALEPDGASEAPVVEQIDTGLDWGSVALGAGVGAMVVLLSLAGTLTYRRRHDHHVPLAH